MTPEAFIAKWRGITRTERSAAQEHFLDLCTLLGVPKPGDVDRHGTEYTFEKSTRKIGDRIGYADVWKRHCFAWEYKGNRRNLVEAYAQLKQYADALENPPLLVVSDMQEIRVHTNFTNAIAQQHVIPLGSLPSVEARELLRNCFLYPDRLRPTATRESVTAQAASEFAKVAVALRRHYDERRVAHFINKLVFCLFAEDIDLLPDRIFADVLDEAFKRPDDFEPMLRDLFRAMANRNGRFGTAPIPWFNGGLFDDDDVLPLGIGAVGDLMNAARLDWKAIDPTIFGTLFESGLDDKKRAEMASLFDAPDSDDCAQASLFDAPAANRGVGIHYTDEATIMKIIEPVVVMPLRREWERIKAEIAALEERRDRAHSPAEQNRLLAGARGLYADFRSRLGGYRVLDPACGSGNFLALSLRALKDFELAVLDDAAAMGLPRDEFRVGPEAVTGIEINSYAAELARLTLWITELQWQLRKGLGLTRRPILDRLDGIVRADALITQNGNDSPWPEADVVVSNPPFLGGKLMRRTLGDAYVERLFAAFAGRVPAEADLVCYWFAKAWERMRDGRLKRSGLVATNSIRGGASRRVLDQIVKGGQIFDAWDDEPWVIKGVAVRVSLICSSAREERLPSQLDGKPVARIGSDLSGSASDLTQAEALSENKGVAFMGDTKGGAFDIPGDLARQWLQLPLNPNGRPNSDVLRPWMNGMDLTRRPSGRWIIDFGWEMDEREATFYEAPFAYCPEPTYRNSDRRQAPTVLLARRRSARYRDCRGGAAARRMREAWLNPPDLVERVPEVVPGYPDRIVPRNAKAAAILKKRTLTNLYNERPAWLDNAHRDLDAAVTAAYGWPADIGEEEALSRLLALNLERASAASKR